MHKQLFAESLLLLTFLPFVVSRSQYVRCFQLFSRKSMDNYQPIMELFYVSPHQCIDQCITAANNGVKIGLCKSFVYNHLQHSCRLYDHLGTQIPAILHPAIGYDFYRRTATTQECAGPLQRFWGKQKPETGDFAARAAQPIRPIDSPIELDDKSTQHTKGNVIDLDLEAGPPSIQPKDLEATTEQTTQLNYKPNYRIVERNHNRTSKLKAPTANSYPAEDNSRPSNLPAGLRPATAYTKPCDTTLGYYLANGNEIRVLSGSSNQNTIVKDVEQNECATLCSKDETPFKCLSFNYDTSSKDCILLNTLALPHGNGKLIRNENMTYGEKFCLPSSNSKCDVDALFLLHADEKSSGRVLRSYENLSNLIGCLRECLNTPECQSASLDPINGRCSLHEKVDNSTNGFEREDGWVTVENGCQRSVASDSETISSEWSEWSACQYKVGKQAVRTRTKTCKTENCEDNGFQFQRC
ncbi:hypothetical protein M3Y94_00399500 [Aphelenchoides besseyi]|nr:hypothetical protein M3Y94_00399500 [Aphelenchoides besseyi]KAI6218460.1 hypothetical protein M3Y95_01166500 [Aphelenchoides besseyi]